MKETTPHTNKERYLQFVLDLGFSRVAHLVLFETGIYYDDASRKKPRRWWEDHRVNQLRGIPIPRNFFIQSGKGSKIDAAQTEAVDHEPPIEVELYGKIDKSGLLHLAAFTGMDENPSYSAHKEQFLVLWAGSSGIIDAFDGKSGR